MFAKKIKFQVIQTKQISDEILILRLATKKQISYWSGQFLSVVIPPFGARKKPVKRCYSFATSSQETSRVGYIELCIKLVPDGLGSSYLASLEEGEHLEAFAPYGCFLFLPPEVGRNVVFIGTGTGLGPLRSMVYSQEFLELKLNAVCLAGFRHESDVLYASDFQEAGVEFVPVVSQPGMKWTGYKGRVTDLLGTGTTNFDWHTTDFYLCGNADMVMDMKRLLMGRYGVCASAIRAESFSVRAHCDQGKRGRGVSVVNSAAP